MPPRQEETNQTMAMRYKKEEEKKRKKTNINIQLIKKKKEEEKEETKNKEEEEEEKGGEIIKEEIRGRHSHASERVGENVYIFSGFETKERTAKGSKMGVVKEPMIKYNIKTRKWKKEYEIKEKKKGINEIGRRRRRISHQRTGASMMPREEKRTTATATKEQQIPYARAGATLNYDGKESLYLIGGDDPSTGLATADIWRYDINTKTWELKVAGDNAIERTNHTTIKYKDQLIITGGEMQGNKNDEIIAYHMTTNTMEHIGYLPTGIAGHTSMLYRGKYMIIYGGEDEQGQRRNETIVCDLETKAIRTLDTKEPPPPMAYHAATKITEKHWLIHGGYPMKDNNIYMLDIEACQWYQVESSEKARVFHHCIHATSSQDIVIFGGKDFRKSIDQLATYQLGFKINHTQNV